jgi:glycosyltransferase involved in cell wall biosynthesis
MSALERLAGRRVLLLNRRDLSNPAAGGAESYSEEIASRFSRAGAEVTLFTSGYDGAAAYDWAHQYLVIRRGGRYGVYLAAARHLQRHGPSYDAIVDFQHGIPFFAPLWAPAKPVVCVVHHVHQAQFDLYFPWPLNLVARLLEGRISRRVYRGRPLVAVSPSTLAEMRRQLGFRQQIYLVPNGTAPLPPSAEVTSASPLISVITRLVPHKRLHLLVEAVPELLARWPGLRVEIAGTGPAADALRQQVRDLALEHAVHLPGRVSEQEKSDLLHRSWLTAVPSQAEGWGLTVMEASAAGVPTIAFDVPGLRDSVRDGVTGWLVPPGQTLAETAAGALEQLADPGRRQATATQCRQWAQRFSWDDSAERLASVVISEMGQAARGTRSGRRPNQLAAVAWWPPARGREVADILRKALRITDVITLSDDGLSVLLLGCDELAASRALERIPIPPAWLRLATTTELLCGSGGKRPR